MEFNPGMKMVVTRMIEPGEEIFADYGPGYRWEDYDGEREGWTFARRRRGEEAHEGGETQARVTRENVREREEEGDSWRWVRPTMMRKRWRSGERRGQESDEEDEEGIGGDRGGQLEEGGGVVKKGVLHTFLVFSPSPPPPKKIPQ